MTYANYTPLVWVLVGAALALGMAMMAGGVLMTFGARKAVAAAAGAKPAMGLVLMASAVLAPPALMASLVVCCAGLVMMAGASVQGPLPSPDMDGQRGHARQLAPGATGNTESVRVFVLDRGGRVVFSTVNGKLVSRFYKEGGLA